MADEHAIARCRHWYRKLLRFYSRPYRERFAESMEQTFNDLCRERAATGKRLGGFVLWMFFETFAGIIRQNITNLIRCTVKQDSVVFLKTVKYSAITLGGLMVAGIVTLMVLARGTGEDITGIVAPALLITFASIVAAIIASILQRREQKAIDLKLNPPK
jgi:hypothetical protein